MFIFSDPPDHTRVRNLFMPLMTPVAVKALEQYIRDRTRALLQPHLAGGQIDFVADFGCFLPMDVIATMTGVPVDDQDRVRGWADDLIARDDKQHDLSERNIGGFINMAQYFEAHSAQHANGPLGNDLLGTILRAEQDGVLQHAQVVRS